MCEEELWGWESVIYKLGKEDDRGAREPPPLRTREAGEGRLYRGEWEIGG